MCYFTLHSTTLPTEWFVTYITQKWMLNICILLDVHSDIIASWTTVTHITWKVTLSVRKLYITLLPEWFVTHVTQKWVCVDFALRHNILWMIFYTLSTKMDAPQYVCTDVFHHDTLLLMIPNSHHTKLGAVHCGFSDAPSDSVTTWMIFYTHHTNKNISVHVSLHSLPSKWLTNNIMGILCPTLSLWNVVITVGGSQVGPNNCLPW